MGDMIRCPKCRTFHYRNDPCPDDDVPTPEQERRSLVVEIAMDPLTYLTISQEPPPSQQSQEH